MVILDAPADTLNYMILGYGVILGGMAIFVVSLAIRFRNARRDIENYQAIEAGEVDE